ncbi:protein containing KNTase C-terminal domain [Anaerolinea thermolimosa]|uniref:Protein containing KNTase C-terminal domain n=1 Tax=Anaerolinea thermolimosa TaxID=229919 RepID=A0A7U9KMU9_9CHLR|nr:kanamycin nucleotidyltransferase C-terminal domain-containing protein [Anaerolinea thermolimosa]GAP08676.1 protein containing KNTase C-terminal domain [Anaerolinea thermolimosa]
MTSSSRSTPLRASPLAFTHEERLARALQIADRFARHFGTRHRATAIYGSLARDQDGPYSDIEMFVIVEGEGIDRPYEWSAGPWKAEVDVYSADEFFRQAAALDEFWPVTHGAFVHWLPLYDPEGLLERGRALALTHTPEEFHQLIIETIIGDLYEIIGKTRNALALRQFSLLPAYAVDAAHFGACLLGLHHRRVYTGSTTVWAESLTLPDPPEGYAPLVEKVLSGKLHPPAAVGRAVNLFWEGVEAWAQQNSLPLIHDLEALLSDG